MKDTFAELVVFVLPTGATTGPRIVLDGINGVIEVYDSTGTLFCVIDPDVGIASVDGAERAQLTVDTSGPLLRLDTGDVDQETAPNVTGRILGAGGTRNLRMTLNSGNFVGQTSARIFTRSESQDGTEPSQIILDADQLALAMTTAAVGPVGAIARKLEVRSATTGAVLGYIPLYNAIP